MNKIEIDQLRMWSHGGQKSYPDHFWKEKIRALIDHLDEVQFDLDDMRRNTEEYRHATLTEVHFPHYVPLPEIPSPLDIVVYDQLEGETHYVPREQSYTTVQPDGSTVDWASHQECLSRTELAGTTWWVCRGCGGKLHEEPLPPQKAVPTNTTFEQLEI